MRYVWIFSALLLSASPSFAMAHKKACPKPAPKPAPELCCFDTRWSGFTVGLNLGALINASDGAVHPSGDFLLPANLPNNLQRDDTFDMHGSAFVGGVQVGGNYQMKAIVMGLETDFNYCSLSKRHRETRTLVSPLSGTFTDRVSQLFNWFGTVRPRFGLAFKPVLIYATGGFAYGHISTKTNVQFSLGGDRYKGSASNWRIGYTVGGGLEWGFTQHWSVKAEYLFIDLQKQRYSDPNDPPPSFPASAYKSRLDTEGHIVRLGVNYTL